MTHQHNLAVVDAAPDPAPTAEAAPKVPLSAGPVQNNVPLPAAPTLQDLLREIPITTPPSSRVFRGVSKGGVTRSANKVGLAVVIADDGDALRVWVTGTAAPAGGGSEGE